MQPADCYRILGVPPGASIEEVTAAYKKLSEKFHPDANAGDPFFQERFKEVQEAHQTLSNSITTEASRRATDQELRSGKIITPSPSVPTGKKRSKAIVGVIFGILLIAVVVFKFVSEHKKVADTEQTLTSLGLLPKDSGNNRKGTASEMPGTTASPAAPAGLESPGATRSISIVRDEIFIMGMMDDANGRLEVYPSFTIFNAKNVLCHAVLYLYDDQGNHLKTENLSEYTNPDGIILASLDFTPQEDEVKYSSGHSDLVLSIPYSKLYLSPGTHRVQYGFVLYDNNWNLLDKSERLSFNIEQPGSS